MIRISMYQKEIYRPKEISEEELVQDIVDIVDIIQSFSGKRRRKVKEELLKELDVYG